MSGLPDCPHRGKRVAGDPPGHVRCFSNRFAGSDFAVRPESVCLHPCPFAGLPNRKKRGGGDLPGLLAQAVNLTAAVASHVAAGAPAASAGEQNARLLTCEGCDRRTDDWRCRECGCHLPEKAAWLDQACPLGKWSGVGSAGARPCGGCRQSRG